MSDDAIRIEYMALSDLVRYPRNAKDHDLGLIGQSIARFGFVEPIVIDEQTGTIIAGHGRLDTLTGMRDDGEDAPARIMAEKGDWYAPVIRGVAFANEDESHAYIIASNRTVEAGGWHGDLLLAELTTLLEHGASIVGTGYDEDDVDAMLAASQYTSDDEPLADLDMETVTATQYGARVKVETAEREDQLAGLLAEHGFPYTRLSGREDDAAT